MIAPNEPDKHLVWLEARGGYGPVGLASSLRGGSNDRARIDPFGKPGESFQ